MIAKLNELSDGEAKYVFDGGKGAYLPVYKEIFKTFKEVIVENTAIKAEFDQFRDTSIFERYMANAAQFSSSKCVATNKLLKENLFDDKGTRKGYSEFKKDAKEITTIVNDTWLRTEYETSVKQAVAGDLFRGYRRDADVFPYWRYLETISANPRPEHLLLVGNIYRIGDPNGDKVMPPNGFSCGCGSEQLDDYDLQDNGLSVRSNEQSELDLKDVDAQFRFNPADQGILPKESHSYFLAQPNANEANGSTFGK